MRGMPIKSEKEEKEREKEAESTEHSDSGKVNITHLMKKSMYILAKCGSSKFKLENDLTT